MFQVRFHGRGGQGVVRAAELLAEAAFREGRHAQAFPSFGSERMGAPVMSFCRIDDQRSGPMSRSPNRTPCSSRTRRCCTGRTCSPGWGVTGYMLINSAKTPSKWNPSRT